MILEVPAYARQVAYDLDTALRQVGRRADSREHQQLRAVPRARAQDDLASASNPLTTLLRADFDASRDAIFYRDPPHRAVRHHLEVRSLSYGIEECANGARASTGPERADKHPEIIKQSFFVI